MSKEYKEGNVVTYSGYSGDDSTYDWSQFERKHSGLELIIGETYEVVSVSYDFSRNPIAIIVKKNNVEGCYYHHVNCFKLKQ